MQSKSEYETQFQTNLSITSELKPITFQINNTSSQLKKQTYQSALLSREDILTRLKKLNQSSVISMFTNKFDLKGYQIYLNWNDHQRQGQAYRGTVRKIQKFGGSITNVLPCPFTQKIDNQVKFLILYWDTEDLIKICDSYTSWRDSPQKQTSVTLQKPQNLNKRQTIILSSKENADPQCQPSQTRIDLVSRFRLESPEVQQKFRWLLQLILCENCVLLKDRQFGALLDKFTFFNLSFFSPIYYKINKIQHIDNFKKLTLLSPERVFCVKSFYNDNKDFQIEIFDYRVRDAENQLEIPKFTGLKRLPSTHSPFQTEEVFEQLQDEYTRLMKQYSLKVQNQMIEQESENEIYIPIPYKFQCTVCQKSFPDYQQHIACEEHRNLTNSQTDYFNEIDEVCDELNEAVVERLKHQPIKVAMKKLILDNSTQFELHKQQSQFSLEMEQTATRTPAYQQQIQNVVQKNFFQKRVFAPIIKNFEVGQLLKKKEQ